MSKVYQIVTDKVLSMMNKGIVPWRRPWTGAARPCNAITGRPYNGGNLFLLSCLGHENPAYLTYKQIVAAGGKVKAGEEKNHFPIFFYSIKDIVNATTGKKEKMFMFRFFLVYNVDQTEGCKLPKRTQVESFDHDPIDSAHAIIEGMPKRPAIKEGGSRACYSPINDTVTVPHVSKFPKAEEYYCTMFHELGHSTGHDSRLNRKEVTDPIRFGSHDYSLEELVAEMTAAFLCAEAGIENATLENSAAYLNSWYAKLSKEPKLFWTAASRAQKAADFILNRKSGEVAPAKVEEEETEAA